MASEAETLLEVEYSALDDNDEVMLTFGATDLATQGYEVVLVVEQGSLKQEPVLSIQLPKQVNFKT